MADDLTHLDDAGRARMVDVAPKAVTAREARARAEVTMLPSTMQVLLDRSLLVSVRVDRVERAHNAQQDPKLPAPSTRRA